MPSSLKNGDTAGDRKEESRVQSQPFGGRMKAWGIKNKGFGQFQRIPLESQLATY